MITKRLIKQEIDRVPKAYLPVLYRIVLALEDRTNDGERSPNPATARANGESWAEFITTTFGCLADAPIERGEQDWYEPREELA